MKTENKISVSLVLNKTIHSRDAAKVLADAISANNSNVELDFSGVEFISRSFADEFYNQKRELESRLQMTITLCNTSNAVSEMLKVIEDTYRNDNKRSFNSIPINEYQPDEFENMLATV